MTLTYDLVYGLMYLFASLASFLAVWLLINFSSEFLHENEVETEDSSKNSGDSRDPGRDSKPVDNGTGREGNPSGTSTGVLSYLRRGAAWVKNVVPVYRWRHPSLKSHLWGFLQGFAEILDGVVTLSTFAFFGSGFEMAVARKRSLSYFRDSKRARDSEAKKKPNLV